MSLRHAAHVLSRPLPQGLATLMYREGSKGEPNHEASAPTKLEHDKWHGKN
jgi:hypothetical protein